MKTLNRLCCLFWVVALPLAVLLLGEEEMGYTQDEINQVNQLIEEPDWLTELAEVYYRGKS